MVRVVGPTGKVSRVALPVASKYRNRITTVDGLKFRSAREAGRYKELKLLETAGAIRALKIHTRWPLALNGVHLCVYEDDFNYVDCASEGSLVVEDVKGARTLLYTLKKRLMLATRGIVITEVS